MRRRKPLVGTASLLATLTIAYLAYKVLGDPMIAAGLAGLPTMVAPAYYSVKRRIVASAAAGVLAPMASGALAWLGIHLAGGRDPGLLDAPLFFAAGLVTGGLVSHVGASILWAAAIGMVYRGVPEAIAAMSGGLALGFATSVGTSIMVGVAKSGVPRLTPGVAAIGLAGAMFLALYVLLSGGASMLGF